MKTAPINVDLLDCMGSDMSVVNAARVSFASESHWEYEKSPVTDKETGEEIGTVLRHKLSERDSKLINYLARNGHTSPFNHAFLSFRVKAPIFVARQMVKHKFLPWNEISRRYVDDEPEFYIPEFRKRAENVKQGSSEEKLHVVQYDDGDGVINYLPPEVFTEQHSENCLELYKQSLDNGMCPEQARIFLPLNTMTEWVWSGSLGAFLDMLKLRLDPHTQQESREVAMEIANHVASLFPVSYNARIN